MSATWMFEIQLFLRGSVRISAAVHFEVEDIKPTAFDSYRMWRHEFLKKVVFVLQMWKISHNKFEVDAPTVVISTSQLNLKVSFSLACIWVLLLRLSKNQREQDLFIFILQVLVFL